MVFLIPFQNMLHNLLSGPCTSFVLASNAGGHKHLLLFFSILASVSILIVVRCIFDLFEDLRVQKFE